jgi:apolipoprotein N-acyltransferase
VAKTHKILFAWLLPAASGALYAFALPPFDVNELGWVALVPLLFAVQDCRPGEAFRRGYVAGLVFFGMTTWWLVHVSPVAPFALTAFLALYTGAAAAWFASCAGGAADSFSRNLLAAIVGTAGWVTLEWMRGHLVLGGFGWNGLAVTQHRNVPFIQFAGWTGVYGVSALVCWVNIAFYQTLRRFAHNFHAQQPLRRLSLEFYVAMTLVCAAFLHGLREVRVPEGEHTLRLALVQGNIPQTLKFDEREKPMILDRYRSLTESVLPLQPQLILWPETATPEALRYDLDSFSLVTNLTQLAQAYLVTGTMDVTPYSRPMEAFNAAIMIRPDGTVGEIYHKIHLVPFGEYVPLRKIFPFMKYLTPVTDSFERGNDHTIFELPGFNFGVVICFEDTLPEVYRGFVQRGVDFMVNLTNDAWFKDSPAAKTHLANAVFRCAETRRWLIRSTNNGITCAVDPYGVVRQSVEPFTPAAQVFTATFSAKQPVTFYVEHGDVFVDGCALVTGLFLLVSQFLRRRRATASSS